MSDLIRQSLPANGQAVLPSGKFLLIIESGAPLTLNFYFNNGSKRVANIGAGYKIQRREVDEPWREVQITGTPGAGFAIFCGEDIEDYLGTVQLTALQRASSLTDTADVTVLGAATLVLAANAARKKAVLVNISSSGEAIRVGSASVTTTRGARVEMGQSIPIESTSDIYAIREGAGPAAVALLEEVL